MLNIDSLDFFIINSIYFSKKDTTTWKIAKNYFKDLNLKTKEGLRELDKKHHLVKNRLKKMEKWGIIIISKNSDGKNEYNLIQENVKICKHKFPDGYYNSILLKINGEWCGFQI